jgi:hypothetical protein
VNAQGDPRRLLRDYRQLRSAQLAYERELGMTPASRRVLQVSGKSPLDLAALMSANTDGAERD